MKNDNFLTKFPGLLKQRIREGMLFFVFLNLAQFAHTQTMDSTKLIRHCSGAVTVTNNGISIVPSFTLGKPAIMFNFVLGSKRLSFDPDMRFSLDGKPWAFLLWGRYKLVNHSKFKLNVGTHLGLNHKTAMLPVNGDTSELNVSRRYLAGEFFPRYSLTKNIRVGIYYLYSHGLDAGTIQHANFITLYTNFSNIKLSKQFYLNISPQLYYLKLDDVDGTYVTASVTFARRNFPLSFSAILNKAIDTRIAGDDLLWNLSLVYAFQKRFIAYQ